MLSGVPICNVVAKNNDIVEITNMVTRATAKITLVNAKRQHTREVATAIADNNSRLALIDYKYRNGNRVMRAADYQSSITDADFAAIPNFTGGTADKYYQTHIVDSLGVLRELKPFDKIQSCLSAAGGNGSTAAQMTDKAQALGAWCNWYLPAASGGGGGREYLNLLRASVSKEPLETKTSDYMRIYNCNAGGYTIGFMGRLSIDASGGGFQIKWDTDDWWNTYCNAPLAPGGNIFSSLIAQQKNASEAQKNAEIAAADARLAAAQRNYDSLVDTRTTSITCCQQLVISGVSGDLTTGAITQQCPSGT